MNWLAHRELGYLNTTIQNGVKQTARKRNPKPNYFAKGKTFQGETLAG